MIVSLKIISSCVADKSVIDDWATNAETPNALE
jgi:hypothetical protein